MADNLARIAAFLQKLTKRERLIVEITLLGALFAFLYLVPYSLLARSVLSAQAGITTMEQDILDQRVQNAELKRRASIDMSASSGWDLADQKSALLFLEDVSGTARRMGVSLVQVHPTKEISKEKYKEISLNLDLKGRYRELGEYFKRLESLSKVVNIRRIRIESCPDTSSVCAAQIEAVTFMAK
jgi:hypothetical protein